MENLPVFQYSPLETTDSIRLVELLPSCGDNLSPIRCKLHHKTLGESKGTYEAISYAWGDWDPSTLIPVYCGDGKALITPNLHSVLSRIRFKSTSRLLWVDALCINQSRDSLALAERARQVGLMNKIFPNAGQVIVDLGELETGDELLMEGLTCLEEMPMKDWLEESSRFKYIFDITQPLLEPDEVWTQPESTSSLSQIISWTRSWIPNVLTGTDPALRWQPIFYNPAFWTRFKVFLERRWFRRLWIIQEYALARSIRIMIGPKIKSTKLFSRALPRAYTRYMHILLSYSGPNHYIELEENDNNQLGSTNVSQGHALVQLLVMRRRFQTHPVEPLKLADTVFFARSFECTDTRDRVYGMYGLVIDSDQERLPVDYTQPVENLAMGVSLSLLQNGNAIWLLHNSVGAGSVIPSWCLDLKGWNLDCLTLLVREDGSLAQPLFNAGGDGTGTGAGFSILQTMQHIVTPNYILDSICEMTGANVNVKDPTLNAAWEEWQLEMWEWTKQHQSDAGRIGPRQRSSFARDCLLTAISDTFRTGTPVRSHSFAGCDAALRAYVAWISETARVVRDGEREPRYTRAELTALRDGATPYMSSLQAASERRLGLTQQHGLLCLLPRHTQLGDCVVVFAGFPIPFVLRPCDDGCFQLVGCCYVHDMMDGQVLTSPAWEKRDIIIR